jgi:hypothetical protein
MPELYRCELRCRRQEVVITRMRAAINELVDWFDSAAELGSPSYANIKFHIDELRAVGRLTAVDIGVEFGPNPPKLPADGG